MRFLLKVSIPTDRANELMQAGAFSKTMDSIMADLKPEAAYFVAEMGERFAYLVIHMNDASELPRIAEPFFHAFGAGVEALPAMVPEDLAKAGPDIERAVKKYG